MQICDHPHRGMTTGQTGIIGSGCHIYPCTLGGLSDKVQQRHPVIGDFVSIGTDAGIFGSVNVGIGLSLERMLKFTAAWMLVRSVALALRFLLEQSKMAIEGPVALYWESVRIGAGTIIENVSELDLFIQNRVRFLPAPMLSTMDADSRFFSARNKKQRDGRARPSLLFTCSLVL